MCYSPVGLVSVNYDKKKNDNDKLTFRNERNSSRLWKPNKQVLKKNKYILFDGLTDNMRRYFTNGVYFSETKCEQ